MAAWREVNCLRTENEIAKEIVVAAYAVHTGRAGAACQFRFGADQGRHLQGRERALGLTRRRKDAKRERR